jgi:hypothetical protein
MLGVYKTLVAENFPVKIEKKLPELETLISAVDSFNERGYPPV